MSDFISNYNQIVKLLNWSDRLVCLFFNMLDEVCECEQEWGPEFIHFIRESFLPAGM